MKPSHLSFLIVVACMHLPSCTTSEEGTTTIIKTSSGNKIRETVNNTWTPNTQTIVNQNYTDCWEFHELSSGDSITVSLNHSTFLLGTFDGSAYSKITFQLPADIQIGQTISLNPIPQNRPSKKEGEYKQLALMKNGEITAFKFGNPLMGWMAKAELASVKIIEIKRSKVIIHLRLKADLEEDWDFDIDKQYILRIANHSKPKP